VTQTELLFDTPQNWREWFSETIEGIERAEEHADSEWFLFALMSLCRVAKSKPKLTADDVAEYMERIAHEMTGKPPETHEKRAMGPVMIRGMRQGWIQRTDQYDTCRRSNQHNCPKRLWVSLIYGRSSVPNGKQPC
jgi:hypothetical protein